MTFIIVNTTNSIVEHLLRNWQNGIDRRYARQYFIRKLGSGTYLMKGNAAVLALLYDLKTKYNENVYIFIAESLSVEPEFPEEVVRVVKLCQERKLHLLEKDLKPLEETKIDCSVSWNQSL
jgi:hypothetical protein